MDLGGSKVAADSEEADSNHSMGFWNRDEALEEISRSKGFLRKLEIYCIPKWFFFCVTTSQLPTYLAVTSVFDELFVHAGSTSCTSLNSMTPVSYYFLFILNEWLFFTVYLSHLQISLP